MPLKVGKSKKVFEANVKELHKKPGKTRDKAIRSLSKKEDISYAEAKRKQAVAIAYSQMRKNKK